MKWRCFEDGAETKNDFRSLYLLCKSRTWNMVCCRSCQRHLSSQVRYFLPLKDFKIVFEQMFDLSMVGNVSVVHELTWTLSSALGRTQSCDVFSTFLKKKHHNLINWKTVDRQWQFSKVTTHFWIKDSDVNIESAVFFSILQRKVLMSISFRKTLRAMFMNITLEYLQVLSWLSQLRFLQLRQKHPHHSLLQK
jgi:hypothetical protein